MRKFILLGCVIILGGLMFSLTARGDALHSSEHVIVLTERGFEPRELMIHKGESVTFSTTVKKPFWPASNLHPSHAIYPAFDAGQPIQPGESWNFVFDQVGDWGFHDHIRSYYIGVIHVTD